MPVNHEIKSQLAKLLATEDLLVEHKKVSTACFNVHTRVLTLPLWEKASNGIYDLLVGHEVGHALFTDDIDWSEKTEIPHQFVNIVEDVRIEKLIKRKYAGLAKTFYNGYKELNEQDFFEIKNEDVTTFNLADRANLYFKIGNFLPLNFTSDENEILSLIASCETFSEVLIAAEKLYNYCKNEKEKKQNVVELDSHSQQGDENSSNSSEQNVQQQSEDEEIENVQSQLINSETLEQFERIEGESVSNVPANSSDEPEVRTAESLRQKIENLVNLMGSENVYVEIPKVNLDTVITKNSEIHQFIDEYFVNQQILKNEWLKMNSLPKYDIYEETDKSFKEFKNSAQKEVNYLVKEFECRKAADSYSRTLTSRTGVLDTSRLHTYKYNENLFKKVNITPDGKNHGLIFILDWSGSMQTVLKDTCKQLYNLIWFCKKISIPFEVYAFTNEWRNPRLESKKYLDSHYQKKEGMVFVSDEFSLMNILTSKVNSRLLESQMINIWRLATCIASPYFCQYQVPSSLSLSGTPLNESLISLHQILPKFQKDNKLQKVQCVILTDGEANSLPYHHQVKRGSEDYLGVCGIKPTRTFLRDRKIGTTYKIEQNYNSLTETLLYNLKDNFPSVNFVGIRILQSRDTFRFVSLYYKQSSPEYDKIMNYWKKHRSINILNSAYDVYFGLSSSSLAQNSEFEVSDDATKAQIKSAFAKSLKTKKLNKKVLGEFISLVV
jgi:hypothetical protein